MNNRTLHFNNALAYMLYVVIAGLLIINVIRVYRGGLTDDAPSDYRTLFTGTNLISQTKNVYDTVAHISLWEKIVEDENLHSTSAPGQIHISAVTYPPHAYFIFVFNQYLTWKQARMAWWLLCIGCFAVILYSFRSMAVVGLGLGFKGSYFALVLGQPMLFVVALIAAILALLKSKRQWIAGVLIPLALIKFTLVVPLLIWLALQHKWKSLFIGGLITGVIYTLIILTIPSIIPAYVDSASIYYDYIYSGSALNLYPTLNSELTSLINVMIPLPMWFVKVVNGLGQLLGFAILAFLFYKKKLNKNWLLYLLYLVSFLFSYHLIYDALILLIPIAFIHNERSGRPWVYLIPFILISLPWNAMAGSYPFIQYHFPIFLLLAFVLAIIEGIRHGEIN